ETKTTAKSTKKSETKTTAKSTKKSETRTTAKSTKKSETKTTAKSTKKSGTKTVTSTEKKSDETDAVPAIAKNKHEQEKITFKLPEVRESDTSKTLETKDLPAPDYKKAGCIDVPYVSQADYPTGCELVSASMLLGYYGLKVTAGELIDGGYIKTAEFRTDPKDKKFYGGDPNFTYIGNPRSSGGYGCYSNTIREMFENYLQDKYFDIYYLTGTSLDELCSLYIDFGQPVMIWASISMEPLHFAESSSWFIEGSDEKFTWLANEHCLVLVGYDEYYYYIHDPLRGAYTAYRRELVDMRYSEMGNQAVTIIPW
ncbi:MAG: C39 family peptidase, partial [Ruminococcus sp.]|nr:C39 family peptidase [Ruminococcus sp.]